MKKLLRRIRQILRDRRTRRFFKRFVGTFAAIVVFVTTYALVLPAIIEAHQHDDSCFEEVLVCDLPESDGHQHVDSCYEKVLVCRKESHTHSPACYRSDFYGDTAESTAVSGAESAAAVAGNTSVTATPTDEIIEGEYSEDEVIEEAGAAAPAADAETEITEDINDYTNTEESSAEASAKLFLHLLPHLLLQTIQILIQEILIQEILTQEILTKKILPHKKRIKQKMQILNQTLMNLQQMTRQRKWLCFILP